MSARPGQFALPLDWSAGGSNDGPLIVGASNADAVRYLRHVATWPVRTAVLTGPRGSGRSLMGRLFARESGGRVIDGHASVSEEEIFHAWNAAQASGTPLLIIADAPPSEGAIALPAAPLDLPWGVSFTEAPRLSASDHWRAAFINSEGSITSVVTRPMMSPVRTLFSTW